MGSGTQATSLLPEIPILTSPAMCAWWPTFIPLSYRVPYLSGFPLDKVLAPRKEKGYMGGCTSATVCKRCNALLAYMFLNTSTPSEFRCGAFIGTPGFMGVF